MDANLYKTEFIKTNCKKQYIHAGKYKQTLLKKILLYLPLFKFVLK